MKHLYIETSFYGLYKKKKKKKQLSKKHCYQTACIRSCLTQNEVLGKCAMGVRYVCEGGEHTGKGRLPACVGVR